MDFTLPEELEMVRDTVRDFVQNELVPIERDVLVREKGGMRGAEIPRDKREHLKKLAVDQGLWAMSVPEALGGGGLNALGMCLVAEELGKSFVDFDFGDIPPILFGGDPAQREKFLKPLISGEKECSIALCEPGTNECNLEATLEADEWLLDGHKSAKEADLFLVFARTETGLSCFVVELDRDGVAYRDGELALDGVRVPPANVLGGIGGARTLLADHMNGRRVRAAARQVGISARLLEMSAQYARDWKSLGQTLAVRPAVRRYLAEMATEVDAARDLVYHAAWEIDEGKPADTTVLRAGLFASETLQRAIDRTIQVYGGPAFASDLPILRTYLAGGAGKRAEKILEVQRFQVANGLTE